MVRALVVLVGMVSMVIWADDQPKDYKNVDPIDLGVQPVPLKTDPKTGFKVGGKNPTDLVAKLSEINGRPIAELEADMRPGAQTEVGSAKGFLGPEESLLKILATDNAFVVDELGLTHQELARHLRVLTAIGLKRVLEAEKADKPSASDPFLYHGRRFQTSFVFYRGYQLSPFKDGTKTDTNATLTNVDSGKTIKFSLLVPEMMERYGFYEGTETPYRLNPSDITAVLDFLKPRRNRP